MLEFEAQAQAVVGEDGRGAECGEGGEYRSGSGPGREAQPPPDVLPQLDLCRIHSLGASLYGNPVLRADGIERVFGQYFDLLLDLVSSPYMDVRSKIQAARHLSLSMFYGYTCRKYEVEDIRKHTRQEETVSRFLDLLYAHHKRERSVAFYAGELCMTPKYLSRIVREVTGRSALESIEDYVVTEAKAMLNSTSMTVQQISDGLNFPSQSVFGKYFKRVTGMSPKEYRDRSYV